MFACAPWLAAGSTVGFLALSMSGGSNAGISNAGSSTQGISTQGDSILREPPPAAAYEVYYHHTLRNKTDHPLEDVRVYLPIPVDDDSQTIRDLRIETGGAAWNVSHRTDVYGTQIRRVSIPKIDAGGEAHVGFSCVVELTAPARVELDPARGKSLDELPKEVRERFTGDDPVFDLKSEIVRTTAAALLRDHPDPITRARAIHDLIASTLAYRAWDGWDPAPAVLARRSGSCSEFSYAFCALCRASGIPTRFVGGSIFPLDSSAPFEDRGWHRWAEAYLPGYGWVAFDPTLDRATPARSEFVGAHHPRVLVLTRIGSRSQQLGLSYIGANSHTGDTTRTRTFTWSQGTQARLAAARKILDEGKLADAREALEQLVKDSPGTRAAEEAKSDLAKPKLDPAKPR